MKVTFTKTALKQLSGVAGKIAQLIVRKIDQYADAPASLANQVKKLQGSDYLRLRVGDYRVIFTEDGVIVTIVKIGHRRDVYH